MDTVLIYCIFTVLKQYYAVNLIKEVIFHEVSQVWLTGKCETKTKCVLKVDRVKLIGLSGVLLHHELQSHDGLWEGSKAGGLK